LKRRFIIEPADLDRRLHTVDDRPDVEGSYRVNELFCGKDTWQAAVLSLMENCDLVAMDLRGFSPDNKGCVFELQSLVAHVPLRKIMLLTDATTDVTFLRQTLDTCWRAVVSSARTSEAESLVLLDTKGRDLAVDTLIAIADEALRQRASIPSPNGTALLAPGSAAFAQSLQSASALAVARRSPPACCRPWCERRATSASARTQIPSLRAQERAGCFFASLRRTSLR
jgi:hypothetical protein